MLEFFAERFETRHHEIHMTSNDALKVLPYIIKNLDEPLAEYAILPTYLLSQFAAEKVKVILSGEGADELFGGYKRYHLYAFYDKFSRGFSKFSNQLPPPCVFGDNQRKLLLGDYFLEINKVAAQQKMLADKSDFQMAGHLNSMLYTDLKNWLVDDLLMKIDKMGMLASLEARVPYLDTKVVEFVLSLSGKLKVGLKARKRLLKAVAIQHIPPEILRRPKHGFTVPVGEWLKGPLKKTFEEIVLDNSKTRGWINSNYVERLLQDHLHGKKKLGLRLWSILIFGWWVEHHLN